MGDVIIDTLVNKDRPTHVLAYVDWEETVRSIEGIWLQKGGGHPTVKCASTLVLAGSTIVCTQ